LRSGKKGAKKEEQYRTMWAELERLVTAHSDQSVKHHAVLECLMEVRQVRGIPSYLFSAYSIQFIVLL
jgi:hypothetical protein